MSHPTVERPLSTHEQGFLDLSNDARQQVVSGIMFLEGRASIEMIRQSLIEFVDKNQQFRCYISDESAPRWINHHAFDIKNHLEPIELTAGDKDSILTLAANRAAVGVPRNLPPWRISLVRYLDVSDQRTRFALVITAHHCLLDGLQGLKLVDHLTMQKKQQKPRRIDGQITPPTNHVKSKLATLYALGRDCLRLPTKAFRGLSNSPTSNRESFSITLSRQGLDHKRKILGCGFQELILGIVGDALSRYSLECKRVGTVRALLPVGRPESPENTFTSNRHDVGFIDLSSPADTTQNSLQKMVQRIRNQIARIRKEQTHGVFKTILNLGSRLPKPARKYFFSLYANRADVLISLIPAGRKRRSLQAATVGSVFAQPAIPPGHGLSVGIVTYAEKVTLALQFDPSVFQNPKSLVRMIEEKANQWSRPNSVQSIPHSIGIA